MKTSKLSCAIRLVLAAQVGTSALVVLPLAQAQQMPAQPAPVMVAQQPGANYPIYYAQPQYPRYQQPPQQVVYAQPPAVNAPQAVMRNPQVTYATPPQPAYPQPMYQQAAPPQQMIYAPPQAMMQPGQAPIYSYPAPPPQQVLSYPQGAVMYPQNPPMVQQGMPYGNVLMQAPGVMPAGAPGMVMVQPGAVPGQQAPVMYQNGLPVQVQGGAVYGYAGSAPQGVVVYPNGVAVQHVANNSAASAMGGFVNSNVPASVVPNTVGATDPELAERPRLQTGSLSKLATSASNRPVQTLTGTELRNINAVNVESALNTLPQTNPGLDRSSNNPGNGRATTDLRGLGADRTAVLVNGRPFAGASGSGTSDLNAIPQSLIKQVDVTTGGASVAYGSGAIAGAVNFVMDENFQGAELNVSHQSTAEQDGALSSVDLTLGTAFADGRGNIAVSVGGSEREAVFQGDREFTSFAQYDSTDDNGNPVLIDGGSSGVPGTSVFSGAFGTYSPDSFGVTFDQNGQIRPFDTSGDQNDFYNYAPVNYLQIPQTRRHATAIANFKLSDSLELYGLGMYSDNETAVQLAATPIFLTSTFTLDGSPFLTGSSQQILSDALGDGIDSDGDGIDDTATAFVRRRLLESGPRRSTLTSESRYVQAGIRGDIGSALEYDFYASQASVDSNRVQEGNVSRSRFQQSLLLDLQADPNGGVCQQTTSDTTDVACTPANIFGEGNISDEAAEFLAAGVSIASKRTESIYGGRLTAKLAQLPGGEARFTVGAERRENAFESEFNLTNLSGSGDQAGFNGGPDLAGTTSSESVYGDIYLPLVANAAGAELVDLELGYRLTDYTTSEGVASYGANASWAPTETLRVRAGYNRAHRAPGIAELFSPQQEGFPGASDPCSASGAPAGGLSPEQVALCIATGVPAELVGSSLINPQSGQVRAVSGGNMNLQEEQADTYSLGFEALLPVGEEGNVRVGADYFSINGSQAIAAFGGGAANVLNNCYDASQSSADEPNQFCQVINRNADGTIDSIELTAQNVASFDVEGVDLFAGVALPALGGSFGVDFNGTFLNTHRFTAYEGDDPIDCAGRFGNLCGEPLPSYSHRVKFGWANDNLGASLTWRHIGEVEDDDDNNSYFVERIGARDYLDAELNLNLANSLGLAVGVQNLTDAGAPVIGDNQEQSNTYPATFDPYGRTYFVRLTGSSSLDGK